VGRIADRILRGATLSSAFEAEKLVPPLAVKMIATGEATGEIDVIMERIAAQMEHEAEVKNSLLTSLMYPALVVLITTGVVTFLVTKVLPKFAQFLASRNAALPPTTQMLIDATKFLNAKGPWILAGLVGGALGVAGLRMTRPGRLLVDRALLSIPVVGRVITLAFVAQFGRTMAILLRSGIQILDALKLLSETVGNKAFGAQLLKAEKEVLEGRPMSQGLRARIIPPLLPELVTTGEATGALDMVLEEMGVFYEKKLQREIKLMATLFEPLMILIVGGIVGFVYIAFFQALYQVSTGGRF
jgi:type IV pilus assembly protein PilC